ncbi:MAG: hypothetical protein JOZ90_03875 [Alphaproteobacteria bacterium]|nr:hypothetical protein [Alphaproteobacteria bacterium]MBV9372775.1 hypothetical protein [Alphaproteobacteria bacterium]MBV9900218.1 hypothetical protein [Alphaproteobacteria bacterium]
MAGETPPGKAAPTPPPDGAEGHDSLADAAEEAVREIEKRRDGSGGYSGEGDIG